MPSDRDPIAPGITERWIHKIIAEAVQKERERITNAVRILPIKPNGYWVEAKSDVISCVAVHAIINGKEVTR